MKFNKNRDIQNFKKLALFIWPYKYLIFLSILLSTIFGIQFSLNQKIIQTKIKIYYPNLLEIQKFILISNNEENEKAKLLNNLNYLKVFRQDLIETFLFDYENKIFKEIKKLSSNKNLHNSIKIYIEKKYENYCDIFIQQKKIFSDQNYIDNKFMNIENLTNKHSKFIEDKYKKNLVEIIKLNKIYNNFSEQKFQKKMSALEKIDLSFKIIYENNYKTIAPITLLMILWFNLFTIIVLFIIIFFLEIFKNPKFK